MASKDTVYVAVTSGSAEVKGQTYTFNAGQTHVRGDHPLAKLPFFEPVDDHVRYEVEQTTAAPGEKRTTRRRRTKKSTSKSTASKSAPAASPKPEAAKPSGLTTQSLQGK